MNLQRHENCGEASPKKQSWYLQPEATDAARNSEPRFEPAAVERIVARASALQDLHRQTLSREQIEAVAAEIGIAPEYVRRSLEQEMAGTASVPVLAAVPEAATSRSDWRMAATSTVTILAYGALATLFMTLGYAANQFNLIAVFGLILPALLAVGLGGLCRSRGSAAAVGAGVAMTSIATLLTSRMSGSTVQIGPEHLQIFALMIGTGTLLGVLGAAGRRQVSKRQLTNRTRRTAARPGL